MPQPQVSRCTPLSPRPSPQTRQPRCVVRRAAARKGQMMLKVIFACVHNAGRSQMAAAFFNHLADPKKAQAVSAGTEPAERVHLEVQAVMQEVGIDLTGAKPQK